MTEMNMNRTGTEVITYCIVYVGVVLSGSVLCYINRAGTVVQ